MSKKDKVNLDENINEPNNRSDADVDLEIQSEEDPAAEKEANYKSAVRLMKCIKCMKVCREKIEMYQQIAKQFSELSGYKNSDELYDESKLLVKLTRKEVNKKTYKKALKLKNAARKAEEFKAAADEFRKVANYKDAEVLATECENICLQLEKKIVVKRLIAYGIVLIALITLILLGTTSQAKYYLANIYQKTNAYNSAIHVYEKLGSYKDSENKVLECQYQKGLELKNSEDYTNAAKAFEAAGAYKDSDDLKVKMQQLVIKKTKPGKLVMIGGCKWLILDITDQQALLMRKEAMDEKPYHNQSGNVTWEASSLRNWLNSEYFVNYFSEAEQKNMILSDVKNNDNSVYGTDGGNDTKDYIYLLSTEEVDKYNSLFPEFKTNGWLRSPGNNQGSAAFLSINKKAMFYGYDTTSEDFKVRPVFWYGLD